MVIIRFLGLFFFWIIPFILLSQEVPEKFSFAGMQLKLEKNIRREIQNRVNLLLENKQTFQKQVKIADLYFPLISEILKENNLPDDLKYLALLDNTASDSLIFWQMASNMASEFGLRLNNQVDERQNIITSTRQIAVFLKKNQNILNNWLMTALTYHLKMDGLQNYLQRIHTNISNFSFSKDFLLNSATHPDILQLLASFIAFKNSVGFNPHIKQQLVSYDQANNKTLSQIANEFALPIEQIRQFNTWLKTDKVPNDKRYELIIPMPAESPSADVNVVTAPNGNFVYETENENFLHIVSKGETLYGIARLYSISPKDLMNWNNLNNSSKLAIGQKLVVQTPTQIKKTEVVQASTVIHTVAKGEYLFAIARKYAVSVQDIRTWNDLISDNLSIGQKLKINQKKKETPIEIKKDEPLDTPKDKPIEKPIDNTPTDRKKGTFETKNGVRVVNSKSVPSILWVGDIQLKITDKAKTAIQNDVNALLRSPTYYLEKLKKLDLYFPLIEKVLKEEGVPDDFKYLPVQESALIGDAISKSKAVGYWQFKEPSAKECGMEINLEVDERMNIISATLGACKYLKRNNLHFKNWLITLLSFNMGFAGAKNYVEINYPKQKLENSNQFEITEFTHWYIRKFLAHKIAFETEIGLENLTKQLNAYTQLGQKTLKEVADLFGSTTWEMKPHNLWLKTSKIPENKTYSVIVPTKK